MSNRRHLVPTPVVTKNGVLTIVHKKPAGSSSASGTIPAPTSLHPATKLTAKERKDIKAMLVGEIFNCARGMEQKIGAGRTSMSL